MERSKGKRDLIEARVASRDDATKPLDPATAASAPSLLAGSSTPRFLRPPRARRSTRQPLHARRVALKLRVLLRIVCTRRPWPAVERTAHAGVLCSFGTPALH
ncbi:hypothetical protein L226DRAFT_265210 [Lentinus tigrinus ALCF2SS1-7]|uniref:uncharacterized protein n=1 Tax=Lentinus tigrinus ALCF2SS1-7 TaxID=1328758 RepID=UPI001165D420|nr:hypothetical protein L226DRAFT_265210 [Lentinus tigrinus ALCF2SS1-7]